MFFVKYLENIKPEIGAKVIKNSCFHFDKLTIINLNNIKQSQYYIVGPREFIYLFNNAEIIFTDSFHACIFSIIFEKKFFVFDRQGINEPNMSTRIDYILDKFNLAERKITSLENVSNLSEIDYSQVYKILNKERQKSLNFLKESLFK